MPVRSQLCNAPTTLSHITGSPILAIYDNSALIGAYLQKSLHRSSESQKPGTSFPIRVVLSPSSVNNLWVVVVTV